MKLLVLLLQLAPFILGFLATPSRARAVLGRLQSSTNLLQCRNYFHKVSDPTQSNVTNHETKPKLFVLVARIDEPMRSKFGVQVKTNPAYNHQ